MHQVPTGPGDQPLTLPDNWNLWTFDLIPTFLYNRRIRPCMHALQKFRVTWLRLAKKNNLWSSQKALEIFQKWIKVIHEKKLRMGRSRRSSIVSEPKTLVFESLFWNVAYKVMTNEHVIEAFKRPIDHVYKANDNRVLNSLLHSRF